MLWIFSLLGLGLVLANPASHIDQCTFHLWAEELLKLGDITSVYGGELPYVSAEAVNAIILEPEFQRRVQAELGPLHQLTLCSNCQVKPGWSSAIMRTSVSKATMNIERYTIDIGREEDWGPAVRVTLKLDYPEDPGSWFLGFHTFSSTDSSIVILSLTQGPAVTIFPRVEGKLRCKLCRARGPDAPQEFPTDYTCLLELNIHTSWPSSKVPAGELFRMKTRSPVVPKSIWRLIVYDFPQWSYINSSEFNGLEYDVTRFYAKNGPLRSYSFAPFEESSLYHHMGFVFTINSDG